MSNSIINFVSDKAEVLNSSQYISFLVSRSGDLNLDCSANIFINGSSIYYPSAEEYDGIKLLVNWAAGDGTTKTVTTQIIPSSSQLSYLDVELTDFVRCSPGNKASSNVAIHSPGVTPSWIPSAPGAYYQIINVGIDGGISVQTLPIPDCNIIPNQTGGTNGSIVRVVSANTWQNASNTDDVDSLYYLSFKQNDKYYKPTSVITGLSNLITAAVYYLDVNGGITTNAPVPTQTTRRLAVGKALANDTFLFDPLIVITG